MGTDLTVTPWGWGRRFRGNGDTCCGSTAVIILYFTIFKAFKLIPTQNSNFDEIDECGHQNFVVRPSSVFTKYLFIYLFYTFCVKWIKAKFCRMKFCSMGMGMGMGTRTVGTGWGWGQSLRGRGGDRMGNGDGDRNHGDGWGWGRALVPVQLSNEHPAYTPAGVEKLLQSSSYGKIWVEW